MTPSELTLSVVAVSKKIGKKIDNSQKKTFTRFAGEGLEKCSSPKL